MIKLSTNGAKVEEAYRALHETSIRVFSKSSITIEDKRCILDLEKKMNELKQLEKYDTEAKDYKLIQEFIDRIAHLELRIKNEVDHMHDVYTHFCSQANIVLSPKFKTKLMIKKGKGIEIDYAICTFSCT